MGGKYAKNLRESCHRRNGGRKVLSPALLVLAYYNWNVKVSLHWSVGLMLQLYGLLVGQTSGP
jgi:hypothetical protein